MSFLDIQFSRDGKIRSYVPIIVIVRDNQDRTDTVLPIIALPRELIKLPVNVLMIPIHRRLEA